jgi:hypothetical protein
MKNTTLRQENGFCLLGNGNKFKFKVFAKSFNDYLVMIKLMSIVNNNKITHS